MVKLHPGIIFSPYPRTTCGMSPLILAKLNNVQLVVLLEGTEKFLFQERVKSMLTNCFGILLKLPVPQS